MSGVVLVCGFAVLLLAGILLEVMARLGYAGLASLDDAVGVVMGRRAGRAAVLGAWLWAGWHLFAR